MPRESYQIRWKDYYQVLGLQPGANPTEVRQAWRRLSETYKAGAAGNTKTNVARLKRLNEAYDVLSDRTRRAQYDQAYQARKDAPPKAAAKPARRRVKPAAPAADAAPAETHEATAAAPAETAEAAPRQSAPIPMPAPAVAHFQPPQQEPERPAPPASKPPVPAAPVKRPAPAAAVKPPAPPAWEEQPTPAAHGQGAGRRNGLVAAAAVVGMALLLFVGVGPALTRKDVPSTPAPASFSPATPTPWPAPAIQPTAAPSTLAPTAQPQPLSPQPTATPAPPEPTATSAPRVRDAISILSPEAEALGYTDFQSSGSAWQVDFSSQCQEAPCLRSGTLVTDSVSSLWMKPGNLSAAARTVSFDIKAFSQACCASFKIVAGPVAGAALPLPTNSSWTRFETNLPGYLPVVLEWQYYRSPTGVGAQDGIWIDNIQFK